MDSDITLNKGTYMELFIIDFINNIIEKNVFVVYMIFFASSFLQIVFPPHPGDVVLVFQGYLTGLSSSFNFFMILINAIIATLAGSLCVYELGYRKGQKVFEYKLVKKWIPVKHVKKAEKIFRKYGHFAVFASKFVPGVNMLILLFSGIFKVKRTEVYISIFFSTLIHHTLLVVLGKFLGNNMPYIKRIISTYNGIIIALLALFIIGAFILYFRRKKTA
ncbi:MAG: DedA family protein [Clostridia bacterium]|nr:DedA family protein [Clostridia bacterium]